MQEEGEEEDFEGEEEEGEVEQEVEGGLQSNLQFGDIEDKKKISFADLMRNV